MDRPLTKEFGDRLIQLIPTPTLPGDDHYYFVGGTLVEGVNVMVHVTVLDESGVPIIGAQVVDQRRDGKGEIAQTDGNGRVSFLYGRGNAYTPPERGPHTICVARDAVKDEETKLVTFVPLSTLVDGLGQYMGTHEEYNIQFRAAKDGVTPAVGSIRGTVINGAGRSINLSGNALNLTAAINNDGSLAFDNIAPGTYTLSVVGTSVVGAVTVVAGQQAFVTLNVPSGVPPDTGELALLRQQVNQIQTILRQIAKALEDAGF